MTGQPPLLTERLDGVLVITLNRPEVRNAVNLPLAEAMARALDDLDGSPELQVGVLTGAGKGFCAAMDLKAFAETGERPWVGDRGVAGIVRRPAAKPLIAAVEGFAVAGGLENLAGLRPHRRRPRGEARHPRGEALARRGRRGAPAPAAPPSAPTSSAR